MALSAFRSVAGSSERVAKARRLDNGGVSPLAVFSQGPVTPPKVSPHASPQKQCANNDNNYTSCLSPPPQDDDDDDDDDDDPRQALFSQSTQATLPANYTQTSQAEEEEQEESYYCIHDEGTGEVIPLQGGCQLVDQQCFYKIGRDPQSFIGGRYASSLIGRRHARLVHNLIDDSLTLKADKNPCYYLQGSSWKRLETGQQVGLAIGEKFRLLPQPKNHHGAAQQRLRDGIQFRVHHVEAPGNRVPAGSESFDRAYLKLLRRIKREGVEQHNKKGASWTLRDSHTLHIDLQSQDGKDLLPLTTLRSLYGGQPSKIEAIWYLRGEKDIKFLQKHNQRFWDKQADENGLVGYNYGLLTHFPVNGEPVNQLETKVIQRLCKGENSRNMSITLNHPGEKTSQPACTSAIQFSVSQEHLDLTVTQRSSDVMLGLPHDVCVWSIILHLVRREVLRRSGRRLAAGKLHFSISAGGAHVYRLNEEAFDTLLQRSPIPNVRPYMVVESELDIFSMAQAYNETSKNACATPANRILIKDYCKGSFHPRLRIEQALDTP